MTTELVIDVGAETVDVSRPAIELDIDVASPSLTIGVPGQRGPTGHQMVFGMYGTVVPKIGSVGFWPRIAGRVVRVTAAVTTQASGATRPDVNIDGATVFTDQSHRPNLNSTGRHFDDADLVDAGSFTATDYITCDVDTAGVGATDLIVTVEYEPT